MDAVAEIGRNPVSKHQIQLEYEDNQAERGRDCRTRLEDQILRRKRGQGNINFPCTGGHDKQDWHLPARSLLLHNVICHDHTSYLVVFSRHFVPIDTTYPILDPIMLQLIFT